MNCDFDIMRQNVIGIVDSVSATEIKVLLEIQAPQNMALNTGVPTKFPRINGYVLIPNEVGALVGMITWMGIEHSKYPARKGFKDFDLLELPFPLRKIYLVPVGTLRHQIDDTNGLTYLLDRGVFNFPSIGDAVIIPTIEQEKAILEISDIQAVVHIGNAAQNKAIPIKVDPDKLFGRHLAILGNTGSGKSCTVAGLIRWSLEAAEKQRKDKKKSVNARFIILDPNGEYSRAFGNENDPLKESVQRYQVLLPEQKEDRNLPLQVPAWMWDSSEWISYTRAAPGIQRPILIDALSAIKNARQISENKYKRYFRYFKGRYEYFNVCASDITAYETGRNYYDLVRTLKYLRDESEQINNELTNSDSDIEDLIDSIKRGTEETLKENEWAPGKYNKFSRIQILRICDLIKSVIEALPDEVKQQNEMGADIPIKFDLSKLESYIDNSAANNDRDLRNFTSFLQFRIHSLISDVRLRSVINPEESIDFLDWLEQYLGKSKERAVYGRLSIIDLSLVPSDIVHMIIAIFSRLIFEAQRRYRRMNGIELPTNLVLEEAHSFVRHVPSDDDMSYSRLCKDTFDKIAREGRKFGLSLLLSSQRPSELSTTVLSQCNTFILHRLVNDKDQEYVRRLVPDNISGLLNELPNLPTRKAILVGWATQIPVLMEIRELPDVQRPQSSDPEFWNVWTGKEKLRRKFNWGEIVREWQGESIKSQGKPNQQ